MGAGNLPAALRTVLSVTGRPELLFIPPSAAGVGQVTTDLLGPRPTPSKGSMLKQRKERLPRHNGTWEFC